MPNDWLLRYVASSSKDCIRLRRSSFVGDVLHYSDVRWIRYEGRHLKTVLGQMARKAVDGKSGERFQKIVDWANKRRLLTFGVVVCRKTGVFVTSDSLMRVITANIGNEGTEFWHKSLREKTFQCHFSNNVYSAEIFDYFESPDYDGPICSIFQDQFHESDGVWYEGRSPESDQDSCREDGRIPGYHQISAPWRNFKNPDQKVLFGVELEIDSTNVRKTCDIAEAHGFIGEEDGSLDDEGIEIVAPPMDLKTIQSDDGPWAQFLKQNKRYEEYMNRDDYGMHVSVSRKALSKIHQIKFVAFIHNNKTLCEAIAGRSGDRWARFMVKKVGPSVFDSGKHEAATCPGQHRIEVRIFQSTIDQARFRANVEFCAATVEFTRNVSMRELKDTRFKEWLSKGRRKTYPNLCNFMFGKRESKQLKLQNT